MMPKSSETKNILFYPDDPPGFYEDIMELIEAKYYVTRASKHQVKYRAVNYYPSTGTITIDGKGRHPEKGLKAVLELLKRMYPKRGPRSPAPTEPPFPPPSPLVLSIDLDDDNGGGNESGHGHDLDNGDGVPW